jgi:hypothetical protein
MILLRSGYYFVIDSEHQAIVSEQSAYFGKQWKTVWKILRPGMHCILRLRVPKEHVSSSEAWNKFYFEGDPSEITIRMMLFEEELAKGDDQPQGFRKHLRKFKDR